MIDLWGVFRNLLWIAGLAVGLAALSVAEYQASEKVRLRQKLAEPASQLLLSFAVTLACVGLFLSGRSWWERAIFGLLALFFGALTVRLRRRARPAGAPARHREPSATRAAWRDSRSASWLGWGLVLAGLLVMGGWNAIAGIRAVENTRSLQSHFQYLERLTVGGANRLDPVDLQSAGQHLLGLRKDLKAIQTHVGPLLRAGRLLRWVPTHGGDLAAASDLLNVATRLSTAGGFRLTNPRMAIAGTTEALPQVAASPTVTSTASQAPGIEAEADSEAAATLVPAPTGFFQELPEVTPPPRGEVYTVAPLAGAVGWVQQGS
jgi:hypothetical protein